MTRFFRQYSRFFILGFMSVLLVIFLIQDAVGRKQRSHEDAVSGLQIGLALGKPVLQRDLTRAGIDLDIAGAMGMGNLPIPGKDEFERNLNAHLLMQEAAQMGVRASREQIRERLDSVPGSGVRFDAVCKQYNCAPEAVNAALERVMSVMELMRVMFEAASGESGPRMEERYRKEAQSADALVSVIDARALLANIPEPTEDEIRAHFEEAKDRAEAHADESLVYGYRIPDRVRVEYLTIDPNDLLPLVSARERELKKHWEQNRKKYTKPIEGPTLPGAEPPPPVELNFDEAKERVKEDYRLAKASEEAQSALNRIREEAYAPWQAMLPDSEGNRPPPATQLNLSFENLAAKHSKDFKVIHRTTELLAADKFAQEPGLKTASVTESRRAIRATQFAYHVEGLPKQASLGERRQLRMLEPSPVMTAASTPATGMSQAFVFRVVEVAPAGPPASLDAIREQVLKNVKMKKALDLAGEFARTIAERAREIGLIAAVAEATDLRQMLTDADTAAKDKPGDPTNPGNNAVKLDPVAPTMFTSRMLFASNFTSSFAGAKALATTTQPVAEGKPNRTLVVADARSQRCAIIQVNGLKPLYLEAYKGRRQQLESTAQQQLQMRFATTWMSKDGIYKRTGFVIKPELGN